MEDNKLIISIKDKNSIERFILICAIGILQSLEEKSITIDEAGRDLFNPFSVDRLAKLHISDEVIEIIELGCELEDIESFLPDQLDKEIKKMKESAIEVLKETGRHLSNDKWLGEYDI